MQRIRTTSFYCHWIQAAHNTRKLPIHVQFEAHTRSITSSAGSCVSCWWFCFSALAPIDNDLKSGRASVTSFSKPCDASPTHAHQPTKAPSNNRSATDRSANAAQLSSEYIKPPNAKYHGTHSNPNAFVDPVGIRRIDHHQCRAHITRNQENRELGEIAGSS
jgi:hypothetical protein